MFDFLSNPTITFIKILAIAYIGIIFGSFSILFGTFIDKYILKKLYTNAEDEKKKTLLKKVSEISLLLSIFYVITYIYRNLLQEIPFPLDGYGGFQYSRLKEFSNPGVILTMMIYSSTVLMNKITIYRQQY